MNVLVVDDSATVRAVVVKTLQISGLEGSAFMQAPNGREALLVMNEHPVDLVFSDINMPVMSGIEMLQQMQAHPTLRQIPIIMFSTEGNAARIEQLRAQGVRAYIRKPFTPELVRTAVEDVLGVPKVG